MKDFSVPGILSGSVHMENAIKSFDTRTDLENGNYGKLLLKIKLDSVGTHTLNDKKKKLKATCMLLKNGTTFTPEEEQILFIEPRFRFANHYQYVLVEENIVMPGGEPYHIFEVEQLTSVQ